MKPRTPVAPPVTTTLPQRFCEMKGACGSMIGRACFMSVSQAPMLLASSPWHPLMSLPPSKDGEMSAWPKHSLVSGRGAGAAQGKRGVEQHF